MAKAFFVWCMCFFCFLLHSKEAEIFRIDFKKTDHPTHKNYLKLQTKMRALRPADTLDVLYEADSRQFSKEAFLKSIEMGKNFILIDPDNNLYPKVIFRKIGNGGPNCVVNYASYNRRYPAFAQEIPENLKNCGFNGWFLGMIGGYPNPTGKELQYTGYPFAWKIFMIREAFNRGFSNRAT